MVSTNILQRTFRIQCGDSGGTCFTVDHRGRQYIVSAAHVLEGISNTDAILLLHEKSWKKVQVNLIGSASPAADVIVLAASMQLSPTHPLPATAAGLALSQDIYFLGFPYGLQVDVGPDLNRDFPIPLVKKGIVSGMDFSEGSLNCLLLDGHNNPGFSGGPVVYNHSEAGDLRVAGVVSGFRVQWSHVYAEDREQATAMAIKENTGIVLAYSIGHAVKLIEANPTGFLLPFGQ